MYLLSHSKIAYIIGCQRQFFEGRDTLIRLWSLAADAQIQLLRIVVLVKADHLPLLAVERVVAGDGAGIAGNLVIDELAIVEDLVVVVIGSANSSHGDHAVIAALVLLEAELLIPIYLFVSKRFDSFL